MSIGIIEKQVFYDNPCAPIVKFDDDDDMFDEKFLGQSNNIGKHVSIQIITIINFSYLSNRTFIKRLFT